jgi:hypothetical protein
VSSKLTVRTSRRESVLSFVLYARWMADQHCNGARDSVAEFGIRNSLRSYWSKDHAGSIPAVVTRIAGEAHVDVRQSSKLK